MWRYFPLLHSCACLIVVLFVRQWSNKRGHNHDPCIHHVTRRHFSWMANNRLRQYRPHKQVLTCPGLGIPLHAMWEGVSSGPCKYWAMYRGGDPEQVGACTGGQGSPWTDRQSHANGNITFPQLRWWAVKIGRWDLKTLDHSFIHLVSFYNVWPIVL